MILDSILVTLKSNVEAFLAILIAISALPQAFSAIKINRIGKRLSTTDLAQNKTIEKLKESVNNVNNSFAIFEKYVKKNEFNKLLKTRINITILDLIDTYEINNNDSINYIKTGKNIYILFSDIYDIGLNKISNKYIKSLAYTAINSSNIKDLDMFVNKLAFELDQFKKNNYNGQTENIYLKICVKFVESFIIQSIKTI